MPLINVVHGDKLPPAPFNLRVPSVRVSGWVMAAWWLARTLFNIVVFLIRHYRVTVPAGVVGYALHEWGVIVTGCVAAAIVGALAVWRWRHRSSFMAVVGYRAVASWRRVWIYRRTWLAATSNTGLTVHLGGSQFVPKIVRVRSDVFGDEVTVRLLAGQHPDDWGKAAPRLAFTFGARSGRAVQDPRRTGRMVLQFRRADPLITTVGPLPVPVMPNLAALPVAMRENGTVWPLRLTGTHVLIAGATDSGKGSVMWSIVSALAGGVRAGLVELWAFDPKGGMELAAGGPLFARFSYDDPQAMAGDLEDAVKVMRRRSAALRGKSRLHVATPGDPTIVILVDELASLTAYVPDRKVRDRIRDALALLLSQGRAVGVHVVAALQDPRKEVLPFRELFPTRIALRLSESEQVELVLDEGARDRGATCDLIPADMPGTGYVLVAGTPEPVRVRFSYHSDAQLSALADDYGTGQVTA